MRSIFSTPEQTSEAAPSLAADGVRRSRRRRRAVIGALAVIAVAGAAIGIGVTDPFKSGGNASGGVSDNTYPTSAATVTREDLSSQTQVNGTLGYAGDYSVVNQAPGTPTSLPAVGQVITQGQVLYEVSGHPVVLLYGSTPAYRTLSESTTSTPTTGADVAELNADLEALGYITSNEVNGFGADVYSYWTMVGVEDLQAALGETVTGTLALGQAVFLPSAARVTTVSATLGGQTGPGQTIMTASSTTRVVTVDLDASEQSEVAVGDQVTITLPNNQTTQGVVSSVGTVATSASGSSTPTITVLVTPTNPAATGTLDQAPVTVSITSGTANDVLAVPVDALVALSGGGYAVEVIGAHGVHHLVAVSLGLFDDAAGMVQVSGLGLAAGQRVVTPGL